MLIPSNLVQFKWPIAAIIYGLYIDGYQIPQQQKQR